MDCSSEESLVRMALDEFQFVKKLEFDIPQRELSIYHEGKLSEIELSIDKLNLGRQTLSSELVEYVPEDTADNQRKLLWSVLIINFSFFGIEVITGLIFRSMGLVADSLDMLADSLVYGISLLAVGGSVSQKKKVARWAGYFQIILALAGLIEVVRRSLGVEIMPEFSVMIGVSFFALLANGACLYLLQKSKSKEAHMQASIIFTSNDVIINLGVIAAGVLVYLSKSGIPDLVIGAIVFAIVVKGALRILKLGR